MRVIKKKKRTLTTEPGEQERQFRNWTQAEQAATSQLDLLELQISDGASLPLFVLGEP